MKEIIMFTIHSKETCPYCIKAKKLLEEKGIKYNEFIYKTEDEIKNFKAKGFKTFPQIYNGDEHIGGYDSLLEYFDNDF